MMKTLITQYALLTVLLLSFGCGTSVKQKPPSEEFVASTAKSLESGDQSPVDYEKLKTEEKWFRMYMEAKLFKKLDQPEKSCAKFKSLEQSAFPLKNLLTIKMLDTCPLDGPELIEMMSNPTPKIQDYAKESFFQVALNKAELNKLPDHEAKLWGELAQFEKTNEGKVSHIQKAFKLATEDETKNNLTEKLHTYAPRFIENPTIENWYQVARDYEKVRNFRIARNYYQKIVDSSETKYELKVKAYWRLAMSHKVGRDKDGYTESLKTMTTWLKNLLKDDPSNKVYSQDYFKYQILVARSYWTLQNSKEAMSLLNSLGQETQASGDTLAHILWLKGSIYLEWKEYDSAIIEFQKAFGQEIKDEEMKLKISWSLPWTFYAKKKYSLAVHYFTESIKRIEDEYDKLKYKFWLAKSYEKLNQMDKASALYKDITGNSAYGYYGILSHNELNRKFEPMTNPNYEKTIDNELSWLIILGELDLAKSYLKQKRTQFKPEEFIGYLPYYLDVKDYSEAMRAYFSISSKTRHQLKNKYEKILFPTPFLEEVKGASTKFDISSSFIYSIMRQESAFDPEARSWADAFGLLQLLPKLAKELSKRAGVKVESYTDLYVPDVNIKLGARHLKDLQIKNKNKFVIYVSSYNASERAVRHWIKTRFKGDYLEFIEKIPYKETRNYVKLVLRNFINYKRELSTDAFLFPNNFFTKNLID